MSRTSLILILWLLPAFLFSCEKQNSEDTSGQQNMNIRGTVMDHPWTTVKGLANVFNHIALINSDEGTDLVCNGSASGGGFTIQPSSQRESKYGIVLLKLSGIDGLQVPDDAAPNDNFAKYTTASDRPIESQLDSDQKETLDFEIDITSHSDQAISGNILSLKGSSTNLSGSFNIEVCPPKIAVD